MAKDSVQLENELKFIEESHKAGIITQQEYDIAKKKVTEKIASLKEQIKQQEEIKPKEEPAPIKPAIEKPIPKVEEYREERSKQVNIKPYGFRIRWPLVAIILIILAVIGFLMFADRFIPEPKPACNFDLDCQKEGYTGECLNASTRFAQCAFSSAESVNVTIISSKDCKFCDVSRMKNSILQLYPGISFSYADENSGLVSKLGIDALPAYVFDQSIEQAKRFASDDPSKTVRNIVEKKGSYYIVKPNAAGSDYFFKREEQENKVILFVITNSKASSEGVKNLLKLIEEHKKIDFEIKVLGKETDDETREAACIETISIEKIADYMACRDLKDKEACLGQVMDEKISKCIKSGKTDTLKANNEGAKKLYINTAPVFLFNNQYKKGGSLSVEILGEYYCKLNKC